MITKRNSTQILRNIFRSVFVCWSIAYILTVLLFLTSCVPGDSMQPAYTGDLYPSQPGKSLGDIQYWWGKSYIAELNTWNGTGWSTNITGSVGPEGPAGPAGPNEVNSTTETDLSGLLVGDSGFVNTIALDSYSKVVWKDASQRALSDINRTATLDWTDLSLGTNTSTNAKFAIVNLYTHIDTYTSGYGYLRIRKNGTEAAYCPNCYPIINTLSDNLSVINVIIGLDDSQVIEYLIRVNGTFQMDSYIDVLGYIE